MPRSSGARWGPGRASRRRGPRPPPPTGYRQLGEDSLRLVAGSAFTRSPRSYPPPCRGGDRRTAMRARIERVNPPMAVSGLRISWATREMTSPSAAAFLGAERQRLRVALDARRWRSAPRSSPRWARSSRGSPMRSATRSPPSAGSPVRCARAWRPTIPTATRWRSSWRRPNAWSGSCNAAGFPAVARYPVGGGGREPGRRRDALPGPPARRGTRHHPRDGPGAEAPPVEADGDQLKQVFLNLLQNAVESAGAGGAVKSPPGRGARNWWRASPTADRPSRPRRCPGSSFPTTPPRPRVPAWGFRYRRTSSSGMAGASR